MRNRQHRYYRAKAVRHLFAELREDYEPVNHTTVGRLLKLVRLVDYGRGEVAERRRHLRNKRNLSAIFGAAQEVTGTVERITFTATLPPKQ